MTGPLKRPAILAIDIGTTSCKAVLFAVGGAVLGTGQAEYPTHHPRPLWAEQDAEDWWTAAVRATRAALQQAAGASAGAGPPEVAAIGLSSQRETVVATDAAGRPLARALTWMDRRGAEEVAALTGQMGAQAIHRRTGMVPDATFTLAKLLWLKRHQAELLRRAVWFLQPRDFVAQRLTGRFVTDPSLASRTMMWDVETGTWWEPAFAEAGIRPERFPPAVPSHSIAGYLLTEAAAALGLASGVPVVAGGGDRCCEALGVGLGVGQAMESTGTTSNLSTVMPALPPSRDPRLAYTAHVLPGQWLVEQGLSATGAILRWLRDLAFSEERRTAQQAGEDVYDRMAAEAEPVPPGSEGLVLLPYFMGARAPRWQPLARGALIGLTPRHGRRHLVRAAMEGVAFELGACKRVLEQAGIPLREIVATGGGARSRLWLAIKAAVMEVPFGVPQTALAASAGAMVLAGWGTGLFRDPLEAARRLNPTRERVEVDPVLSAAYRPLAARYERLAQAILRLSPRLHPQP